MTPPGARPDQSIRAISSRRSWLIAAFLAGLAASAHVAAIWVAIDGRDGLRGDWPIWRDDHPLYFHSALATRSFLKASGTTAGYDPAFMSGYAKSVVFPASSTLPELVVAAFGGDHPQRAYNGYVFVSAACLPWLMLAAAWAWRAGPVGVVVAVLAFLLYLWTDFPINYAAFGMLPYLVAVPLGFLATGAFVRYLDSGGVARWVAAAFLLTGVVLVHFTAAMIVAPACLLAYVGRWGDADPEGGSRIDGRLHRGVWLIPPTVLVLNAFWWWPGLWLASTKGASDFAFAHPEGVLTRLRQILSTEPAIERWLWGLGLVGLAALRSRRWSMRLGLLGFLGAGFFWGYLAGGFRSLDFLQPGRHTYAFYTALALATGLGVEAALRRLRRARPFRLDVPAALALLGGVVWWVGPPLEASLRYRVLSPRPFLSSRPSPAMLWVLGRVGRHVRPGERLYYEEGGFDVPGLPDPYQGGRFSGLLPWRHGVEVIGGPYLHAALTTNFTQFGEAKLFGRERWDRDWFVRYARLYRPAAILCWTPWARAFCRDHPDLIEIRDDNGLFLIGRVKGFDGDAIEGRARVEAAPGRLRVRADEGGVDGSVVLRYHSVPCLRSDPPVAWEPVFLEDDPVPFIKLRPTPGTVTFELRAPGAPRISTAR